MNVVLISIDSLRADALSCYGSTWVKTPHLDRRADEGILFENTIVQTPHTIPSHASMLTERPGDKRVNSLLSLERANGSRQVFDLGLDPEETEDISKERPELAAAMESELRTFLATHGQGVAETPMTPAETAVTAERLRGLGYID
jgi:hypothetical protein